MALKLRVTPEQVSYRPGDTSTVVVEVVTEHVTGAVQAAATHLEALQLELCAVERVDVNWVSAKYRAASLPLEKDNRRVARPLLTMQPVKLCERTTLLPGSRRLYMIRLRLPESLPPSFRGSAVRYTYQLEAKAVFAPQLWAGTPVSTPHSVDFKARPSLLLPETPALQQAEASASHSHPSLPNHGSRSSLKGSAQEAGQQRRRGPGIVHVKAPIHIWPLPDVGDQAQPRGGILAGDDSNPRMTSYPVDQQPLDLCLSASDLLDPEADLPHQLEARQRQVLVGSSSDMSARLSNGKAAAEQSKPSATSEVNGEATLVTAAEPATPSGNAAVETPMTGKARPSRQSTREGAGLSAASPSSALAEGASLRSYNLKVGEHPLVRLTLHPPLEGQLQLGTTLAGTLDFRFSQAAAQQEPAAPRCMQVVIMLETEEKVQDQWQAPSKRQTPPIRKVHDEHQELTPDTLLAHFMFTLPLEESASFSTHLMQHSWILRFEFTTVYPQQASGWGLSKARGPETVTWLLPIFVAPPSS